MKLKRRWGCGSGDTCQCPAVDISLEQPRLSTLIAAALVANALAELTPIMGDHSPHGPKPGQPPQGVQQRLVLILRFWRISVVYWEKSLK